MTEETSAPPSRALARRLRDLIANIDATSVESTAKQVCEWIDSFKDDDDRFRGLLRLSAEIGLEEVMDRRNQDFRHSLGRFCKILDTATGGESSRFLNSSWKQAIHAAGAELQANTMAEAGTWPEYHALVTFAGELCDQSLLQPDSLRSCISMLCGLESNLGLELACTLIEETGYTLRGDRDGERYLDASIQAMLSASGRDGISARMRRRVQELVAQQTTGRARRSDSVQLDDETVNLGTSEDRRATQTTPQPCKPRHPRFYFGSGDVVFVCEETSFRVQSDLLSSNSQVLSEMLVQVRSNVEHLSDGCPCVHLSDTAEDFGTLLRVFYTSGFLHRHKTPDFVTFSSILRMATKYKFQGIRSQILLDLRSAYPIKFSDYEASSCRGEAVFGLPLPHPNSVLDLFVKCNVTSALPFAFYRAYLVGNPALLKAKEVVLLPSTFESVLCGYMRLKADEVQLAETLAFKDCGSWLCSGKTPATRIQIFKWIHPKTTTRSGILERVPFTGSGFCSQCLKTFAEGLSEAKENTWENLPSYFGLPPWPWDSPTLHLYPIDDSFAPKCIALLPQRRVTIGRQTNAATAPTGRNGYFGSKILSRRHAEVWEQDGKIYIRDLKSSNGTFINDERLSNKGLESKPFELKSDDIVGFGTNVATRVLCILNEQDAYVAARAE